MEHTSEELTFKLSRIAKLWNLSHEQPNTPFYQADALAILIPPVENQATPPPPQLEQFPIWLLDNELPESLIVITRGGEVHVLTTQPIASPQTLPTHPKLTVHPPVNTASPSPPPPFLSSLPLNTRFLTIHPPTPHTPSISYFLEHLSTFSKPSNAEDSSTTLPPSAPRQMEISTLSYIMAVQSPLELANTRKAAAFACHLMKHRLIHHIETVLDSEIQTTHLQISQQVEKPLDGAIKKRLKEKLEIEVEDTEIIYSNVQSNGKPIEDGKEKSSSKDASSPSSASPKNTSSNSFSLLPSAEPSATTNLNLTDGCILASIGTRYREMCANLVRTLLVNGKKEEKEIYQFCLEVRSRVLEEMKVGVKCGEVYTKALEFVIEKRPDLKDKFVKNVGHLMRMDFRDRHYVMGGRGERGVIEEGMVFNVSVGFNGGPGSGFAVWIADTVVIKGKGSAASVNGETDRVSGDVQVKQDPHTQATAGTGSSSSPSTLDHIVVLTDASSRVLDNICYELMDEDTGAAPENQQKGGKDSTRTGEDKGSSSKQGGQSGSSTSGNTSSRGISSAVLNNADSVILSERLRSRRAASGTQAFSAEDIAECEKTQKLLREKKQLELKKRLEDVGNLGNFHQKRKVLKLDTIRSFTEQDNFPVDLEKHKIYTDPRSECLFAPIHGVPIPFHISTIKNVTFSSGDSSSKRCTLRINFKVPSSKVSGVGGGGFAKGLGGGGSQHNMEDDEKGGTSGASKETSKQLNTATNSLFNDNNPLPDLIAPNSLFIKELIFNSLNGKHLQSIDRSVKELIKSVKQKEEEADVARDLADKETLIISPALNRSGYSTSARVMLKDLMIRPSIQGNKRVVGMLEAHSNGLRFSINSRMSGGGGGASGGHSSDFVDIIFSNIKHAFFQPCEKELIILIHFNLFFPIMVGKKKTQDIQFYTEAGTQIDDLDHHNRSRSNYQDPDETLDEMRERELRRRLNSEFKRFVRQVEDIAGNYVGEGGGGSNSAQFGSKGVENSVPNGGGGDKLEFEIPFRDLMFRGVPAKSNVEIFPTAHCLVHLVEWPPFILTLDDIEIVSFERVQHGLREFDTTFVFKDYSKPVKKIDLVPIIYLDLLKRWLNELEIVWYEGRNNLQWGNILRTIADDVPSFIEEGGFDGFLGDASDNEEENGSDDESEDDNYSQDDSEEDEDEESEEADSDDETLVDESDDDSYQEEDSDEEGLSWDELEERAEKDDRKRKFNADADEDSPSSSRKKKKKH